MAQITATADDAGHLSRALELASRARGHTSPNPLVGAVLVKDGRTIGEGFHAAAGEPHAEVEALAHCDEDPAGATLYVTLEPCAHEGRTPPCAEAIAAAEVSRVVVASDDPTPKASGRGLGVLRDEGVEVDVIEDGEIAAAARLLNQPFRKHARTGRPLVVFKFAMTLDGKVATRTGDSRWISGEHSRSRSHRWRAELDAVAVGIGTAAADDPMLTARVEGVASQPRRIVFDSEASLSLDSRLMTSTDEAPVVVVVSRAASRTACDALRAAGAEIVVAHGANEAARIESALDELGTHEIQSILLEGGPRVAGSFFEAGEIDEARVFIAPLIAGGRDARPAIEGQGVELIGAAARAKQTDLEQIDEDVLITARLKEW